MLLEVAGETLAQMAAAPRQQKQVGWDACCAWHSTLPSMHSVPTAAPPERVLAVPLMLQAVPRRAESAEQLQQQQQQEEAEMEDLHARLAAVKG